MCDAIWSEYHWPEAFVLDELPLARAFMYYRAIQARYDVEGKHPRFEDDERSGAGHADFRRQIRAALAAFKRRNKTTPAGSPSGNQEPAVAQRAMAGKPTTKNPEPQNHEQTTRSKTVKHKLSATLALFILACGLSRADDVVAPQYLSGGKLYRDATTINFTTNVHYTQGATILLTNMICYSSANLGTNSVIQGLSNVTVEVSMSSDSTTTGTWVNATVQSATAGTWYCSYSAFPESAQVYWQCRLTDSLTNVYYYMIQKVYADPHL